MGCCSLRTEPSAKPWCVRRFPGVLAVPGPSHGPLAVQGEAAPGLTLIALLTIMMASCSDRSVSSMNCSAPPRRMMVQVLALGQPVKKLYLEKGGFGDGEAAAGQAVWGHSQPSSSVPLTAPADPRLRRSRARECRSEIPADPGKSTLFLLPGIHAELELPICTWQEYGGQQPAPNRIAPTATGRTPVYTVPSFSCPTGKCHAGTSQKCHNQPHSVLLFCYKCNSTTVLSTRHCRIHTYF